MAATAAAIHSDSDMDLSSDEQPIPRTKTTTTADSDTQPVRDEMQRGIDYIGFDDADLEEECDSDYKATMDHANRQGTNTMVQKSRDSSSSQSKRDGASSSHGQKRKRNAEDESDDEEGPLTGPPAGCPWMGHRQYSKLPSVPLMLTQELKDFVEYISPTREEHQVRKYVFQLVEAAIKSMWPDARAVVFGSFETRLYLPSSDLDLVVLCDRNFRKDDLRALGNHLKKLNVSQEVTVLTGAKVPLVKIRERVSGLPVDISFNLTNGIKSAMIVKKFLQETPVLRPLTLLIKQFLLIKGHNEVFSGGLGSYTTMIMILSFLQMHPQIQTKKINPEDNLGVLLIEFFELYGLCFNYFKVGLSVLDGGSYFIKQDNIRSRRGPIRNSGNMNDRHSDLFLSSIDPNDTTNDTASGSYQLKKVREVFVGAYGALTSNVHQRTRELFGEDAVSGRIKDDRKSREHYRFDDHNRVPVDSKEKSSGLHRPHAVQVSLIRDILAVPYYVLQHRRHLEKVFYDGYFQEMFNDPKGIQGLDQLETEEKWAAEEEERQLRELSEGGLEEGLPTSLGKKGASSYLKVDEHSNNRKAEIKDKRAQELKERQERDRLLKEAKRAKDARKTETSAAQKEFMGPRGLPTPATNEILNKILLPRAPKPIYDPALDVAVDDGLTIAEKCKAVKDLFDEVQEEGDFERVLTAQQQVAQLLTQRMIEKEKLRLGRLRSLDDLAEVISGGAAAPSATDSATDSATTADATTATGGSGVDGEGINLSKSQKDAYYAEALSAVHKKLPEIARTEDFVRRVNIFNQSAEKEGRMLLDPMARFTSKKSRASAGGEEGSTGVGSASLGGTLSKNVAHVSDSNSTSVSGRNDVGHGLGESRSKIVARRIAPLRDVEFVHAEDSDSEEGGDEYFDQLMKEGAKEYEDSEEGEFQDEDEKEEEGELGAESAMGTAVKRVGMSKNQKRKLKRMKLEAERRGQQAASHEKDEAAGAGGMVVDEVADAIQLPQLQSAMAAVHALPPKPKNSSRNEQLKALDLERQRQ